MSTDEEKISSLYQQGNNETPPSQLDDAILNAAHDAVNSASPERKTRDTHAKRPGHKHPKAKSPFSGSWLATVSIAAVLIITVIMVPLMEQELQQEPSETTSQTTDLDSRLNTSDEKYEQESVDKLKSETASKEQSQKAKKRSLMKTPERQSDQAASMPALMSAGKTASNFSKTESDAEEKSLADNLAEDAAEVETSAVIMTAKLWLEKIQRLIDAGDLKLAAQELNEFKKQYPNEEIEQSIIDSLNR